MSDFRPRVSVIVPTYNCAGFLEVCLDSVVGQDYSNLEIVVMDGGSADGTVAVARAYGDRIAKVVSEPDKGIYDAMNKGIEASTGEWLFFLGADDMLSSPDVVTTMLASEAAQDDDTLMLYGDVNSARIGARYRGRTELPEIIDHNVCHQSIFYRRRLFDIEGLYDLRYRLYADWDLNLKVYLRHPKKHRYVDCLVAEYNEGASSEVRDAVFDADLEENIWRYASEGPSASRGEVMAKLYVRAIKAARKRGDARAALTLSVAALRRSSIVRLAFEKALGRLTRG